MKAVTLFGPPGCGKTSQMLLWLEGSKASYKIGEIGFLSFTKAGAAEALKRLGIPRSPTICTIHSLMYSLGELTGAAVVNWQKLKKFTEKSGYQFRSISNDTGEQMEIGDQFLAILSKAQNQQITLRQAYHDSDRPSDLSNFEFFCKSYNDWKHSNGYIDFNDMIQKYVDAPTEHGIKVLFVDEAQDLSNLQWAAINAMIKVGGIQEVYVAGDDDQAIYEWSGANVHGMAEFEERYKAERVILTQSWRVPQLVHSCAMGIIERIDNRVEKIYHPKQGEVGVLRRSSILNTHLFKHGDDVMILCRNYLTRKEMEDELIRDQIPYKNEGGLPSLYDSKWADAIRTWNKIAAGAMATCSDAELDKFFNIATEQTKKDMQAKRWDEIVKRGHMRCFTIPYSLLDFFRSADLTKVPTIRLSTIHSAKGREADHVVIHTGLTQKTLLDMDKNADAEARVWYVGVTRARHKLDILEGDQGYSL